MILLNVLNLIPDRAGIAWLTALIVLSPLAASAAAERDFHTRVEPLLKSYCFDCHGEGANKGEVTLDEYTNFTAHVSDQKLWLAVWQNLQTQMMPPAKKTQPTDAERREIIRWIERDVFKLDPATSSN